MNAPFIEISGSGPDIPDGVYQVILTDIVGPRTVTAQRGPKAGQDIDLLDWKFAVESGQYENTEIEASTSTASGPRSKMYAFLTALFGGKAPPVGTRLEKEQIVGRSALATLQKDDSGWLRITNLGAVPGGFEQRAAQATEAAPQPPTPTPAREVVAKASSDLPF